jgi:hypothetical protein
MGEYLREIEMRMGESQKSKKTEKSKSWKLVSYTPDLLSFKNLSV